jgi:hypothetical protein
MVRLALLIQSAADLSTDNAGKWLDPTFDKGDRAAMKNEKQGHGG